MDSLGIDENGSPVIIEYKRASNENVIDQGLFYLDWLMDHRRDFEWLVLEKFGPDLAKRVDWSAPRLVCIAGDFTKYDIHAVNQMNRNIALMRYRRFGEELLLFELLTSAQSRPSRNTIENVPFNNDNSVTRNTSRHKTVTQYLADADSELLDLYESVKAHLLALGDDVELKVLDNYAAFRRLKNFACMEVKSQIRHQKIYVKVNPDSIPLERGFTRDVRNIGHFGTGDLEIIVTSPLDFYRAKPLLEIIYENS